MSDGTNGRSRNASLLRRRRLWRFGEASFDEARWSVGGQAVPLQAKPLELLRELLQQAGEVVTKDELLEAVWPGVAVTEASLATAVSQIRKALGRGGIMMSGGPVTPRRAKVASSSSPTRPTGCAT